MLPTANIDEDFLMEDLFSKSDGEFTLDELREQLDDRVCEYFQKYEHPEREPIITPNILYMMRWTKMFERVKAEWDAMSQTERRQALWKAALARSERFYAHYGCKTTKDNR